MDWQAFRVSLSLAICTTAILTVVGLPLAWWLARSPSRFRFVVESVVSLSLVLPPSVLGFYLLVLLTPAHPLGRLLRFCIGTTLPFTFAGILIGSVLFCLPAAIRPFQTAFAALDHRLLEASWCLGVSRAETFRRVVIPLAWPGILMGMILTFCQTMGEFGVVLFIGGNIPGQTRTLSIALFDELQIDMNAAHRTAMILLGIAFASLVSIHLLQMRARSR